MKILLVLCFSTLLLSFGKCDFLDGILNIARLKVDIATNIVDHTADIMKTGAKKVMDTINHIRPNDKKKPEETKPTHGEGLLDVRFGVH